MAGRNPRGYDPKAYAGAAGGWVSRHRGLLSMLFVIVFLVFALPAALLAMMPTILSWLAPPLNLSQDLYAVNRPQAFTFLDARGREVGHRGALIGERLHLDDMPAFLPSAFIAMEDRHFYSHHGFDIRGLVLAQLPRPPRSGGRIDDHAADGEDHLSDAAAHLFAQISGIHRCGGAGEVALEEPDPRDLS
jgi:membrane peptidoglycan carboxypeptidase